MRSCIIFCVVFVKFLVADELIFVQPVWRHGDRNPLLAYDGTTFTNDPYGNESQWVEGWGDLTQKGMQQHVDLGMTLAKKYVYDQKFIDHGPYKSHQIYVRSTDVNRTIISAISNFIGFYSNQSTAGVDFPNITSWPQGYVPIAIHTAALYEDDHIGDPDADCQRQSQLQDLIKKTPEYQALMNNETYKKNMVDIKNITGWANMRFEDIWALEDTLYIEYFVYNTTHPQTSTSKRLMDYFGWINSTTDIFYDWYGGWGLQKYQNIDFSIEIPKIRGGPLLWSIIGLMQQKLNCYNNTNDKSDLCRWIGPLRYYAYSAHDSTLSALFSALGTKRSNYNEDGYPHYSSAIVTELWINSTTKQPYVKVNYYPLARNQINHDFEEITPEIPGCAGANACSLDDFVKRSQPYKPGSDGNAVTWCNTDLFPKSSNNAMKLGLSGMFLAVILFVCNF